jgi:hypothetical protein
VNFFGETGNFPGRGTGMKHSLAGHFGNNRRGFLQTLLSFFYIFLFYGSEHLLGMALHLRAETPIADTAFLVLPIAFDSGLMICQLNLHNG